MKKIIRLTESDLNRIIKRVINESDNKLFFLRRLRKYDSLIDYKMKESLKSYCKGGTKKEYVQWVKDFILVSIERNDFDNIHFYFGVDEFSEDTKKFEKFFDLLYSKKIESYYDNNCK